MLADVVSVSVSRVLFEDVTKSFGEVVAVDSLDLEVIDGEFLVLLGPSGCGKTTVLRMVAGLETVTQGTLRIGNRVVNDVEAKDRDVAMVFQSYALYPHMNVRKNIESPLVARHFSVDGGAPRKLTASERSQRITQAAETLGLASLLDRKPAALSGGKRQRVALARAIVSRPAAFLMDEPLSNLDAKLRAETRLELVELHRKLGTTIIYVTHDQVEAMTMADRIAVISDGRLQQVGAAQEVYDRPSNLFVAHFMGSPPMNTFEATVAWGGREGEVTGAAGRVRIDAGPAISLPPVGSRVVVGVRPEHLRSQGHGQQGRQQEGLRARVSAVEWLGYERHVICDVAGRTITLREPAEGQAPNLGEEIYLDVVANHVLLFDPATSERIP